MYVACSNMWLSQVRYSIDTNTIFIFWDRENSVRYEYEISQKCATAAQYCTIFWRLYWFDIFNYYSHIASFLIGRYFAPNDTIISWFVAESLLSGYVHSVWIFNLVDQKIGEWVSSCIVGSLNRNTCMEVSGRWPSTAWYYWFISWMKARRNILKACFS